MLAAIPSGRRRKRYSRRLPPKRVFTIALRSEAGPLFFCPFEYVVPSISRANATVRQNIAWWAPMSYRRLSLVLFALIPLASTPSCGPRQCIPINEPRNLCNDSPEAKRPENVYRNTQGKQNSDVLAIRVVDGSSGTPMPKAAVYFQRGVDGSEHYQTGENGTLRVSKSKVNLSRTSQDTIFVRFVGYNTSAFSLESPQADSVVVAIEPCSTPPFSLTMVCD